MIDNPIELAAGALGGVGFASVLARAFIAKSMKDLETAVVKIGEIKTELAAIAVKLESMSKAHELIHHLDKKIIAIETKLNGRARPISADSKG